MQTLRFRDGAAISRALTNAHIFASREPGLPNLNVVRFEFDGKQLELLSTDRYRGFIESVEHDFDDSESTTEPFAFSLPREYVGAAAKLLKGAGYGGAWLTVRDDGIATVRTYDASSDYRTLDAADFPNVRSVWPSEAGRRAVERVKFNPKYLADLGRVQTGEKHSSPIRLHFHGDDKVVLAEWDAGVERSIRLIVMPYRETK